MADETTAGQGQAAQGGLQGDALVELQRRTRALAQAQSQLVRAQQDLLDLQLELRLQHGRAAQEVPDPGTGQWVRVQAPRPPLPASVAARLPLDRRAL